MANISAHDIFKQVKDQVFYLRELGELSVPIGEYIDDKLTAYWQDDKNITVEFKGKKKLIPCDIHSKNYDYIARCIMQGFAQIYLNKNESNEHCELSKENMMEAMEKVISQLVNEGIMETNNNGINSEEDEEKEYHFIWDNDKIILRLLYEIAGGYSHYVSSDIDKYDAYVEFDNATVIVSVDDNGYIYVNKVESTHTSNKQESVSLWNEVSDCIKQINNINTRLNDMQISGRRNY